MAPFTVRQVSALSPDRLYRVLFAPSEILFIDLGGQPMGQLIAAQFGLLGMLVYRPIQKKSRAKLEARIRELDAQPPGAHLATGEHDFRAPVSEIEASTLHPASALGGHGRHFGRWILQLRGRKPMTLQLESEDDMRRALETLPLAMGLHASQVAWNAAQGKFAKTS